jgi:hypothetical protein
LLPGSPAIDAGDPMAVAGMDGVPEFDQRGDPFGRVVGGRIDMGAFELQPLPAAFFGDYNLDGRVDGGDYVKWRNSLGTGGLGPYEGADGSGNGSIGLEDYQVWKLHYGDLVPMGPGSGGVATMADSMMWHNPRPAAGTSVGARQDAAAVSRNLPRDEALVAWLEDRIEGARERFDDESDVGGAIVEDDNTTDDAFLDGVDAVFQLVGGGG